MAETLQVRVNSLAENLAVLRELQARKEVQDRRTKDELDTLFWKVNAECTRRSAKDKSEKTQKVGHYGHLSGFPSGKWWGIRMDCSRDCVHEPLNENVAQGPFGATSVCTSHLNTYNDVDLGDILTFTGQEYSANDKSKDSLTLSHKNRVPIRLVRSYCLSNDYAPKTGCRYDGLYTVIDHWLGSSADNTKYHKFALVRVLNQVSPVWAGKVSRFSIINSTKKSLSPRLTRSFKKIIPQKSKTPKFVYNKVVGEPNLGTVSAIVSRQVFNKQIPGSPDSSPKSVSGSDSSSFCLVSCAKKSCNTNLSIRTNLYNSSPQDAKRSSNYTFKPTSYLKSNQFLRYSQKNQPEAEKPGTDTSDTEGTDKTPSIRYSPTNECSEKKIKRVTWAVTPESKNGYKTNDSNVFVNKNPSSLKQSPSQSSSMKTFQHVAQIHAVATPPPNANALATMCEIHQESSDESAGELSMSIDSLAPDKLVSIIVKEKYHPMAKLLIGNMIGLENGESEILGAYNTLISKINQDDSKVPSKENKLRSKFYIRNKTRKNGVSKKQRREIANLIIDAKFDPVTRGSRRRRLRSPKKYPMSKSEMSQRKLVNARRIPSRNLNKDMRKPKEIRSANIDMQSKKIEKRKRKQDEPEVTVKRPKMVNSGVQCMLLVAPSVDQAEQCNTVTCTGTSPMEVEEASRYFDDVIKSEPRSIDNEAMVYDNAPCELTSNVAEKGSSNVFRSAFVAVNAVSSSIRIARLRSIGFKPIRSTPVIEEDSNQLNQDYDRPEVDEEYNKYTSEETDEVAYLEEELHFEDIEDEVVVMNAKKICEEKRRENYRNLLPQPMETLPEKDFDRPWHGWKKICANGQSLWIGY
ncbi:uncharacterized protein LOC106646264 [Copidosoma floridanum]|uniref:uncharacterized protein LOC106646264 n=1 Tax=Copidosoma floridanum TaxID=29053 RepID=UPI0006C974DC|nr:uncharacterized protein LOC106646264 [Copidosoma floridanum]